MGYRSQGRTGTPGQKSTPLGHAIRPARLQFHDLKRMASFALQLPLPSGERQQHPNQGREVRRLLLPAHVPLHGTGDVGPALAVVDGDSLTLLPHYRWQRRTLKTVFCSIGTDPIGYVGATQAFTSGRPIV